MTLTATSCSSGDSTLPPRYVSPYRNTQVRANNEVRDYRENGELWRYILFDDEQHIKIYKTWYLYAPDYGERLRHHIEIINGNAVDRTYYRNGQLKTLYLYPGANAYALEANNMKGVVYKYYKGGKIQKVADVLGKAFHGEFKEYNQRGCLRYHGYMYDAKLRGEFREYCYDTDKLLAQQFFIGDKCITAQIMSHLGLKERKKNRLIKISNEDALAIKLLYNIDCLPNIITTHSPYVDLDSYMLHVK